MKFSNITWQKYESMVRATAGADRMEPPSVLFREMSNVVLSYLFRVLEGKHGHEYRKTFNLVLTTDEDTLQLAAIGALQLDPVQGALFIRSNAYVFRTGDRLFMQGVSTSEAEIAGFRATVVNGGLTAMLSEVVINGANQGYAPTLADYGSGAALKVVHSHALLVADLSSLYMKAIVGATDTGPGETRIWTIIKNYRVFRQLVLDDAYDAEVAAYLRGDVLEVFVGTDADAIAGGVLEYDGRPEEYTIATQDNEIELFQEYYAMLYDIMLGWTLDWLRKPKDGVLTQRIGQHLEMIGEVKAIERGQQ